MAWTHRLLIAALAALTGTAVQVTPSSAEVLIDPTGSVSTTDVPVVEPTDAPVLESTASQPVVAPNGALGSDITVTLGGAYSGRTYTLFVPTKLPANPPLVLLLHGYGYTSAMAEIQTGFDLNAGRRGYLVAYPQGVGRSWNAGPCCETARDENVDDIGYLEAVIADISGRYAVASNHIAMGGFSNGALMSYRFSCERSDLVSHIFVGSGTNVAPQCTYSTPVSILAMHGLKDTRVPWTGTSDTSVSLVGMPPVSRVLLQAANRDGCQLGVTNTTLGAGATQRVVGPCPAGTSVQAVTSPNMTHMWAATAADAALYGMNETALTWTWLGSSFGV